MSDQDDQQLDKTAAAIAARFSRDMKLEDQFRTRAENQIGVPDYVTIASDAYAAYVRVQDSDRRGHPTDDCSTWLSLPAGYRLAWTAAVRAAIESFVAEIFGDPGCFARAFAKGEPTFTLRGQDPTTPALVAEWIGMNLGAPEFKLQEALRIAKAMADWPDQKEAD